MDSGAGLRKSTLDQQNKKSKISVISGQSLPANKTCGHIRKYARRANWKKRNLRNQRTIITRQQDLRTYTKVRRTSKLEEA
jgi:hypothetical protein